MIKTWQQRCEDHPDHDGIVSDGMIQARMQEEIDELRAALEQAQEPVAWMHEWDGTTQLNRIDPEFYGDHWKHTPLYTAPPQRQWQELTDDEIWSDGSTMDLSEDGIRNFARAIEAKLKEKNNA